VGARVEVREAADERAQPRCLHVELGQPSQVGETLGECLSPVGPLLKIQTSRSRLKLSRRECPR